MFYLSWPLLVCDQLEELKRKQKLDRQKELEKRRKLDAKRSAAAIQEQTEGKVGVCCDGFDLKLGEAKMSSKNDTSTGLMLCLLSPGCVHTQI